MREEVIAVFIPIVFAVVTGLVLVTVFYLRSKEKQALIDKGLSAEDMKAYFREKKDPYVLMKIGIVILFFGLGLGFGLMLEDNTTKEYWVPFSLFTFSGMGFVLANVLSMKMNKRAE
ncbi:MAG TPA: hypothetical protein PKA80_00665 [Ignavibacteriaceae bacterium]|nr:hypothetical protein [Ignavibacteriaceae bacterium]